MPRPVIEFWFDFGSNYSYLSMMRIEEEASVRDIEVIWRPFMLSAIFKAMGWNEAPFLRQPEKRRYVWQDMARQCRKYGLPWTPPTTFPRRAVLPHRVALLGHNAPWMAAFCRAIVHRNFAEDRDIDSVAAVSAVLDALHLPAEAIIHASQAIANKRRLHGQTEEARKRGIFGAPTFFAEGEMFWGNDRLDDALALASRGRLPGP